MIGTEWASSVFILFSKFSKFWDKGAELDKKLTYRSKKIIECNVKIALVHLIAEGIKKCN